MNTRAFFRVAACLVAAWPASASTLTTLYSPSGTGDGAGPQGGFITVSGTLYGMTTFGGTTGNGSIVKIDPSTGAETVLYNFAGGSDGSMPGGNFLDVGGVLYGTTEYGGANGSGTVFTFNPSSGTESVVWSFTGAEGQDPLCTLIALNGQLFGTTEYGGAHGSGTVFKFSPPAGTASAVYSFGTNSDGVQSIAALVDVGGTLFGTSETGGGKGFGAIFSVDPASGAESVAYSFAGGTDGNYPASGLSLAKGVLYGSTEVGGTDHLGTIFSFNPATGKEKVLHSFSGASDGDYPLAGVNIVNGVLYGAANGGGASNRGTVFSLTVSKTTLTVLHAFDGVDGGFPYAAPSLVSGTVFGTTGYGGTNQQGAIYAVTLSDQTESVLHNFTGSTPIESLGLTVLNKTLYALASNAGSAGGGDVLRLKPSTGAATEITDFALGAGAFVPSGDLTPVSGALFGVAAVGGNAGCHGHGCGSVFKIDPSTGAQTQIYAFGPNDANGFVGDLLDVSGMLYGTSYNGGPADSGTVFKIDPSAGTETIVYSFTGGADGGAPFAPLLYLDGNLYGTATYGGANGAGVIFKIDLKTGVEKAVYSFGAAGDGTSPYSGLIDVGGAFYGTTFAGGANGWGTVYRFSPSTSTEVVLHSFAANGTDGTQPGGNLISLNGLLYGMTVYGGKPGAGCDYNVCGTVFSIDPASGAEAIVHAFAGGAEGGNPPYANLVAIGGVLYGSTGSAGVNGLGTVFSLKP